MTDSMTDSMVDSFPVDHDLRDKLKELHRLWFQIGELRDRFSGRAEDKARELTAEFYVLARDVIGSILDNFKAWAYAHTPEGWWRRARGDLFRDVPANPRGYTTRDRIGKPIGVLDWWGDGRSIEVSDMVLDRANEVVRQEQEMSDMAMLEEFEVLEHSHMASEFLDANAQRWGVPPENVPDDDYDAFSFMRDEVGLDGLDEFMRWSMANGYFDPYVDFSDYGIEELENYPGVIDRLKDDPEIAREAYEQFRSFFPMYEEVLENVKRTIGRLESIQGSPDVDQVMSEISLALNVAHNSGVMAQHLELTNEELDEMSNIDTSPWSSQVRQYSSAPWVLTRRR